MRTYVSRSPGGDQGGGRLHVGPFELDAPVTIAIDTEYHGPETLTIQAATRLDAGRIAVQIYRAPGVPAPPADFDVQRYFDDHSYSSFLDRVIHRPTRKITTSLSPARIVRDLFGVDDIETVNRSQGAALLRGLAPGAADLPGNLSFDPRTKRCRVPTIQLTFVGHFLPADFQRFIGRTFLESLLRRDVCCEGLEISAQKLFTFREPGRRTGAAGALVEYARLVDGRLFAIRVRMQDISLVFGSGSLDDHSRTFLGMSKSEALTTKDKENMRRTFRKRTCDAYTYAIVDVATTLLVYEQMKEKDREIYQSFGFPEGSIPPLRSTLGSRVNDFLIRATRSVAAGSTTLTSGAALKNLMRDGGHSLFERHPDASRFGRQTGTVHGGLIYSRTPTRFWHEAPGQIRDVDMAHCYADVLAGFNVYWGRPVIFEPGKDAMTLCEAVKIARRHADSDAWFIRASGEIANAPNALITSTEGALTSRNYQARKRRRAAGRGATTDGRNPREHEGAHPYSATVRSGVITSTTWDIIQAMPRAIRRDYERLRAESIVLYPRKLVARDGAEYDRLIAKHAQDEVPWRSVVDLGRMEKVLVEQIDASYVALRFPVGDYARKLGEFRREKQRTAGMGSGAEKALKEQANTLYGVLGSRFKDACNFVAANVTTAQARAEAFALVQSLNGFQVITDGCTYRRDQIPACTFAECLRIHPDYPIRRAEAESGIPFLDPATIPDDDARFTAWYREHIRRFFGAKSEGLARVVATHELVHKATGVPGSASIDALATDGCSNYLKATQDPAGGWRVGAIKVRSYGKGSKLVLQEWIIRTYPADRLLELPPITEDMDLLKYDEAIQHTRSALKAGIAVVYVPLGLGHRKVGNYKVFKPSAFIFETPEQRTAIIKQIRKFEARTGCGLELLALRRSYGDRREGSLADLAEEIYQRIRAGEHDLAKALNMNRKLGHLGEVSTERLAALEARRTAARDALFTAIDMSGVDPKGILTGRLLTADV